MKDKTQRLHIHRLRTKMKRRKEMALTMEAFNRCAKSVAAFDDKTKRKALLANLALIP